MKMNLYKKSIYIVLPLFLLALSFGGCKKKGNCPGPDDVPVAPMTAATFRIFDSEGRDLLSSKTPNHLSFDSLSAWQPCRKDQVLQKNITQVGQGALEGYIFSFNTRHPNTGENVECFTVTLDWGNGITDVISYDGKTEHHTCGITYHLYGVKFNGKDVNIEEGHYILRR